MSYPNESVEILVSYTWNFHCINLLIENSSSLNFKLHSLLVLIAPAPVIQEVGSTILIFLKKQSIYG